MYYFIFFLYRQTAFAISYLAKAVWSFEKISKLLYLVTFASEIAKTSRSKTSSLPAKG